MKSIKSNIQRIRDKYGKKKIVVALSLLVCILFCLAIGSVYITSNEKQNNTDKVVEDKLTEKSGDQEEIEKEETDKQEELDKEKDSEENTSKEEIKESSSDSKNNSELTKSVNSTTENSSLSSNSVSKPSDSNSSGSSSASKPSHTHTWVEQFKTIHHDAVYETKYVVDTPAWDEQVPRYEMKEHVFCNNCGADITGFAVSHIESNFANGCRSYRSDWVQEVVGYDTVHHDEVGHNEQVLVKEAYDQKVSTGYKCSCGATK